MAKKYIFFFILLLCNSLLIAQVNKNGIPFIKNYSPNEYDASEQNWAVCEDQRGVIYVANNDDGILEFDGYKWNKIPIANESIVRSLAYLDGTIYVGGVDEFGYLAPNKLGKMQYVSLIDQLDTIEFKDVWKIFIQDNSVYFCSDKSIFKFKEKRLEKVYKNVEGSFLSFQVRGNIFWGNYDNGLYELIEDSVILANGGEFFKEKDIFAMLPWSENEILVSTMQNGLYIYSSNTGLVRDFKLPGEDFKHLISELNNSQIYNGIKLSNGNYALATLNNGCIVFTPEGELVYKIDKENGLQDFTVINLFESANGHLWLGLNKGISFIELNTPFTRLGQEYGLEGIVMDVIRFNETLVVATNIGLYCLDYDENRLPFFHKIDFDGTVSAVEIFENKQAGDKRLFLGTQWGLQEYKGKNREPEVISEEQYEIDFIYQSKIDYNKVYLGTKLGLAVIKYNNGNWHDEGFYSENISAEISTIIEDKDGNIWVGTSLSGIIRYGEDQSVKSYTEENGLPNIKDIKVYQINDQIVAATKKGVYSYNTESDKFEKFTGFGEKYLNSRDEIKFIDKINENEFWIVLVDSNTGIEYIEKLSVSQDRIITISNVPFKRLVNNSFYKVFSDGDNGDWIATSDAIYNYQEKLNEDFTRYYNSLIRRVQMGFDSVVFYGTFYQDTNRLVVDLKQPSELKTVAKYRNNSFVFYYSSPFIPTEELKYSYKLEGYDEDWSIWENKTERPYTNLDNGHYVFKVKAKNIYGIESEVIEYEFTIKPPWYKTLVAYFFYLVLAVLIIIVIVKIYTRRLELEKIRLEQIVKERTEEVVKQKEEIEQQRDEIADKNRSITDSIEYASRIQTAVLPSNEFAEEILPEHFILFRPRDIVSGDFYWMTKKDNLLVMIAADCTGHGVPGAFMSMLGVSFLNEIVNRHEINSAGAILTQLRADVKKTLGQEGKEGEAKDGMDIALCIVDMENMKMQYAGAYNPLYLYRNNELLEVKADRMPIGIYIKEKESFTNNEIDLQKGDTFYIFSDGYQDQFGGEDGQKFKTKNYKQLLLKIHQKPMAEQKEILNTRIDEWRGEWEQVDDIIILGVRI